MDYKSINSDATKQVIDLVLSDPLRVQALEALHSLDIEYAYLAAGFVRNCVWDALHDKPKATPLNDVDVIYFDQHSSSEHQFQIEQQLQKIMPQLNWEVRNQALMHHKNGDRPYRDCVDAMSFWPEQETAVAIRKVAANEYQLVTAFGVQSLLGGFITPNPKRELAVCLARVKQKQWLAQWPRLTLVKEPTCL